MRCKGKKLSPSASDAQIPHGKIGEYNAGVYCRHWGRFGSVWVNRHGISLVRCGHVWNLLTSVTWRSNIVNNRCVQEDSHFNVRGSCGRALLYFLDDWLSSDCDHPLLQEDTKLQLEAMRITLTQVHTSQLRLVSGELAAQCEDTCSTLEMQHRAKLSMLETQQRIELSNLEAQYTDELESVRAELAQLQTLQQKTETGRSVKQASSSPQSSTCWYTPLLTVLPQGQRWKR